MNRLSDTDLKGHIRTIANYPKPGIMFRDITTLLGDPRAFRGRSVSRFSVVIPWTPPLGKPCRSRVSWTPTDTESAAPPGGPAARIDSGGRSGPEQGFLPGDAVTWVTHFLL